MKTAVLVMALLAFFIPAALSQNDPDGLLAEGKVALRRSDAEHAAELFEKAVAVRPNSADAHYWLARAYGAIGQNSENPLKQMSMGGKMKDEAERAVQLDPNHIEARFMLIDAYVIAPAMMGGSEAKALEQANEIKRNDAFQGHRAYVRIYTLQKKIDLARNEYLAAVREEPNSARAHNALGAFFAITDKNYPGAFEEIEKALKLDSTYMPAWFRLGQVAALSASNFARGEEALKKYLKYQPKDTEPELANAHYRLGQIYENQGKKTEAKQSYVAALQLNPGLKEAAEGLKRMS
jgi:Tfp pilus assembly protein PilF